MTVEMVSSTRSSSSDGQVSRPRPPRIGQIPRRSAIDEEDVTATNNRKNQNKHNEQQKVSVVDHEHKNGVAKMSSSPNNHTTTNGAATNSANKQTNNGNNLKDNKKNVNNGGGGGVGAVKEVLQNTKNAMISSFASVIESTKDLTLSEEQRHRNGKRIDRHNRPSPSDSLESDSLDSPRTSESGQAMDKSSSDLLLHKRRSGSPESLPSIARRMDVRSGSIPSDSSSNLVTLNASQVPVPAKCSAQLRRLIHSHSLSQPAPPQAPILGPRPIQPNLPYSPYGSPNSSPRVKRKPLRETKRVNSINDQSGEYIQLNQYKLGGPIGEGSYGIVKLAYNKEDDTNYAMKILSKKKLKRKAGIFGRGLPNRKAPGGGQRKMAEDPLQKVYREIAIMKKLDHPNVVKLVEVLDDPEEDNMYMVFELLQGGEIVQIPTDEPMDEKDAWSAFRDVIMGLEYLHYQKIIHRDLKPSNILKMHKEGVVKLADLGVSNEFHGQDAFLTNTAGTPAFTPPESLSHKPGDEPYSGKAADIWSLGVTLYCFATGKVPFHDDNILALYNKIRTQDFDFPEGIEVSPELKDLIRKMLIKDPAKRITLAEIKVHDWVTGHGLFPLATEEENCILVEVTDSEVDESVRSVPKLDTLILVKTMIKNHSFTNPFTTIKSKFRDEGRSNSAPECEVVDLENASEYITF